MGGQLTGSVRDGVVPAGLKPAWENQSPALAEVVRDINKYSNNVMTQQVLLTLGKERMGVGSLEAGRAALAQWWQLRWPAAEMPQVEQRCRLEPPCAHQRAGAGAHAANSVGLVGDAGICGLHADLWHGWHAAPQQSQCQRAFEDRVTA